MVRIIYLFVHQCILKIFHYLLFIQHVSNTSKYSTVEKLSGHLCTMIGKNFEDAGFTLADEPQNCISNFVVFNTSFGCILSFSCFSISNFICTDTMRVTYTSMFRVCTNCHEMRRGFVCVILSVRGC